MGKNPKNSQRDAIVAALMHGGVDLQAERTRQSLTALLDFCTVEGALIGAPEFVRYIEMARLELEHWNPYRAPSRRSRSSRNQSN